MFIRKSDGKAGFQWQTKCLEVIQSASSFGFFPVSEGVFPCHFHLRLTLWGPLARESVLCD